MKSFLKVPSEVEVAPRYTLLVSTVYTVDTVESESDSDLFLTLGKVVVVIAT